MPVINYTIEEHFGVANTDPNAYTISFGPSYRRPGYMVHKRLYAPLTQARGLIEYELYWLRHEDLIDDFEYKLGELVLNGNGIREVVEWASQGNEPCRVFDRYLFQDKRSIHEGLVRLAKIAFGRDGTLLILSENVRPQDFDVPPVIGQLTFAVDDLNVPEVPYNGNWTSAVDFVAGTSVGSGSNRGESVHHPHTGDTGQLEVAKVSGVNVLVYEWQLKLTKDDAVRALYEYYSVKIDQLRDNLDHYEIFNRY